MAKIKNQILLNTAKALRELDPIRDKDGKLQREFKFTGLVRLAMARLLKRLTIECETIEQTRQQLMKDHKLEAVQEPGQEWARLVGKQEDISKYQDEWKRVTEAEIEFQVHYFSETDFNVDKNEIPNGTLSELLWLIKGEEEKDKPK
jgi:hypothetical protein